MEFFTQSGRAPKRGDSARMPNPEERVGDALRLWEAGRPEGAFLLAIIAVIVRARQLYPDDREGDAFRRYIESRFGPRLSIEYRGVQWPIERLFYTWFRCEIVHQGGLPVDIRFMDGEGADALIVRAGGAPEYVVLVSPAWFHQLIEWARA